MPADIARAEFKPEEWWNGNAHLAHQIGSMALLHRDIGNSYPTSLSDDAWKDILTRIGEPLMTYAAGIDESDGYADRAVAAKAALELFALWFDKFWD